MAKIKPFAGYLPSAHLAPQVASLPYDVLSSQEAYQIAHSNPLSYLHVAKSEIDFPLDSKIDTVKIYEKGRDNLKQLIQDQTLLQTPKEIFYLYQQTTSNIISNKCRISVWCSYRVGRVYILFLSIKKNKSRYNAIRKDQI